MDGGNCSRQRPDALLRHQVHHRIAVAGIEAFGRMRDGIDTARHAQRGGQRHAQRWIVDDGARQHARIVAGFLEAGFGNAVDRCHFRARVGGGHGDHRKSGVEGDGLAQPYGRATADRDGAVGAKFACHLPGMARGFYRYVHDGLVEHARHAWRAQQCCDLFGLRALRWCAEYERTVQAQRIEFGAQLDEAARAEDHALRAAVVDERGHKCAGSRRFIQRRSCGF